MVSDSEGEPIKMTDGAGLVSLDIAQRAPAVQQGKKVAGHRGSREHKGGTKLAVMQVGVVKVWMRGLIGVAIDVEGVRSSRSAGHTHPGIILSCAAWWFELTL